MANTTLNVILKLIKQLADSTDEFGRANIQNELRKVQYDLETPYETVMRLSLDTCQVSLARLAADMGLFKYLASSEKSQPVDELVNHFGAGKDLLTRIMRYLASVNMVEETGKDEYAANKITKSLAIPGYEAGVYHAFDNLCPILMALPEFLAERKYQDIVDGQDTVFQNVFKTDQHCFPWIASQPNRLANFQVLMTVERSPNWLSTFPMDDEVATWSADGDKAIFVDMGAGLGQGCTQFRDMYPNLPGRIVLQELPPFIQIMKPVDRVELMAHNFFTPQPVKGAKFYFLRLILRDYIDEVAIDILKNIIPAMDKPHSRIIVDDVVAPETGAHWAETGTDICIMGALGSRERTEKHWKELFFRAGLQFKGLYPWSHPVVNAAMVLALE